MQRHEAGLAELASAHGQDAVVQVDVVSIQRHRLSQAQAADGDQPEEGSEGAGAKARG